MTRPPAPRFGLLLAVSLLFLLAVSAATKDEWRTRSIYQSAPAPSPRPRCLADPYPRVLPAQTPHRQVRPPSSSAPALTAPLPAVCDPTLQTWCGGTWRSIIDRLNYGTQWFDAIWISCVGRGEGGQRTRRGMCSSSFLPSFPPFLLAETAPHLVSPLFPSSHPSPTPPHPPHTPHKKTSNKKQPTTSHTTDTG